MKKFIFLFLLSISFSTFSQQKDTNNYQQFQNIQFVLTGTVIDSETSERLEYATITLKDKRNQEKVFGGISDDNGNFSISISKKLIFGQSFLDKFSNSMSSISISFSYKSIK